MKKLIVLMALLMQMTAHAQSLTLTNNNPYCSATFVVYAVDQCSSNTSACDMISNSITVGPSSSVTYNTMCQFTYAGSAGWSYLANAFNQSYPGTVKLSYTPTSTSCSGYSCLGAPSTWSTTGFCQSSATFGPVSGICWGSSVTITVN